MVISRSSARPRPPASTSPTSCVSRGCSIGCSCRRTVWIEPSRISQSVHTEAEEEAPIGAFRSSTTREEEFPLTTGDSPEAELPPADYEQDLGQVQPSPEAAVAEGDEAAAEEAAADIDVDVEPTAVQEEGAESEHPLAYHPISSVLARPTILWPAVTGYPTLRIDRTGIWQLVAAEQSESAAAAGALLLFSCPRLLG